MIIKKSFEQLLIKILLLNGDLTSNLIRDLDEMRINNPIRNHFNREFSISGIENESYADIYKILSNHFIYDMCKTIYDSIENKTIVKLSEFFYRFFNVLNDTLIERSQEFIEASLLNTHSIGIIKEYCSIFIEKYDEESLGDINVEWLEGNRYL